MSFRLEYASDRKEIWRWYWRSWRRWLWPLHLIIFLAVASWIRLSVRQSLPEAGAWAVGAAGGLAALCAMVLYPQLRFRPQTRVLMVGKEGVETTIGRCHDTYDWKQFKSVRDEDGAIVLSLGACAFIVPARAFGTPAARADFLSFVRERLGRRS